MTPPIPFAASITTRCRWIASRSTKDSTLSTKAGKTSSSRTCPGTWSRGVAEGDTARSRMSSRPESPPTGSAPRRTTFIPVYSFGLCDAVTWMPAVEPEVADREVEHLGADEPDVDHVGPGGRGALDRRLRHRRRRDAHVAPDGDPLRLELLDVGAPDRARAVLVDLARIDPADVVGFEDLRIEHRRDGKRGLDRSYT